MAVRVYTPITCAGCKAVGQGIGEVFFPKQVHNAYEDGSELEIVSYPDGWRAPNPRAGLFLPLCSKCSKKIGDY
jgi:hypothetical protein